MISLIGSFTNLRGGHVYPDLVLKAEKKPIRVFLQDGVNDNRNARNPERDWYLQNQAMVAALKEKGYDHEVRLRRGRPLGRPRRGDPAGHAALDVAGLPGRGRSAEEDMVEAGRGGEAGSGRSCFRDTPPRRRPTPAENTRGRRASAT